jgi:NAD(P)-dependent dehydrogenase (short-subunit alcohol dehydrogenase family)
METNVTGAFLHSREAAKVMMAKKSGAIVNIASYAAYFARGSRPTPPRRAPWLS